MRLGPCMKLSKLLRGPISRARPQQLASVRAAGKRWESCMLTCTSSMPSVCDLDACACRRACEDKHADAMRWLPMRRLMRVACRLAGRRVHVTVRAWDARCMESISAAVASRCANMQAWRNGVLQGMQVRDVICMVVTRTRSHFQGS